MINRKLLYFISLLALGFSLALHSNIITVSAAGTPSITYSTHVQSYGWMNTVKDGTLSGTTGQSKRVEAIKISLKNTPYTGGISYKTHIQDYGWLNSVSNGAVSGKTGQSKQAEAIQISLTGEMSKYYDVYYRVHSQTYGWLGWAKNGQSAGTQGLSKRVEAIEIRLVKKGNAAPGSTNRSFVTDSTDLSVIYSTHAQDYGWLNTVKDGEVSGTIGESKRLEAIKVSLKNAPYSGGISYKTHMQSYGWLNSVTNGAISGKTGESKQAEAIQINLTGEMNNHYDVYYRVHSQDYGWLGWAKNGQSAGTQGLSKRIEAIEIRLVEKGKAAPGSPNRPFVVDLSVTYSTHVQDYGWMNTVKDGQTSGTIGETKQVEAIQIALKNAPYSGGISYQTHVENYGWLNPVANGAISGKTGESKRVEAIQISLTGEMNTYYDIYYRVHSQDYGWLGWAKNGMKAGTEGVAKQVEAIEIKLVPKGQGATVNENDAYKNQLFITYNYYNLTFANALAMQMKVSPQTDKYKNSPAYVSGQYLQVFDGGKITGSGVNLRTTPKLTDSSNIYKKVGTGTAILVLDNNITGDISSGSTRWFKIEYEGQTLYVHSSLATTNSRVGRVTADTLNVRSEKSSSSHSYGTVKNGTLLTILEESGDWYRISYNAWRNATSSDVQYYLNPANFVNDEVQKFQFMNLSKPSGISADVLNQYLQGKGILAGQGQAFVDAGNKFGINEVYLMAHTILETGNGTSTLAKGVDYNGKKVYNMYGVGAYDDCPVDCGAETAYNNGWFTPYDAIVGGAAFIEDGYVSGNNKYNIIQNTLFEMRWNPELMNNKGFASHQYATDIGWAYKQVKIMSDVYKIKPYTLYLEIPVFK